MRSAYPTESMICEPPKPRLMTRCFGKSSANDFQSRMLELPMKRMAPGGGGLVRSDASNARISLSKGAGVDAADATGYCLPPRLVRQRADRTSQGNRARVLLAVALI